MAGKRNDNRHIQNISKIYLILAIVVAVFIILVQLKVVPVWLAVTSIILVALLFLMQLGAMAEKKKKEEN
jgi:Flp pilus assembly protein TadB